MNNGGFESFFAAVTDTSSADFGLKGTANVVARTSIGDVPISGIPFDVQSSLKGINSFGGSARLSNVTIAGSEPERDAPRTLRHKYSLRAGDKQAKEISATATGPLRRMRAHKVGSKLYCEYSPLPSKRGTSWVPFSLLPRVLADHRD